MADHMMKKYIAKVEKTKWIVEELEIMAETERQAEEILDDYCAGSEHGISELKSGVKLLETAVQEEEVDSQWIESSEELSVDEFMAIDGGQTAYRD